MSINSQTPQADRVAERDDFDADRVYKAPLWRYYGIEHSGHRVTVGESIDDAIRRLAECEINVRVRRTELKLARKIKRKARRELFKRVVRSAGNGVPVTGFEKAAFTAAFVFSMSNLWMLI